MAATLPWLATESGCTYITGGSPDPKVNLSGTATTISLYPTRTFAEAATDSNTAFADGDTCWALFVDEADADSWELYSAVVWNDDTVDYLDLSSAEKIGQGPGGALSNADTVTVYAEPSVGVDYPERSTVTISSGAAAFTLDGGSATCQLTEDLTTPTVPLPSGGVAANFEYGKRVDFTAPGAGGPFAVSIPTAWLQLGPLDAISLSAGDEAIVMILTTYADGSIGYTAALGVPGA